MKTKEAFKIMKNHSLSKVKGMFTRAKNKGYMISFEKYKEHILRSDHFPDKHAGEPLIKDEETAWKLARIFANQTTSAEYVNIYVTDYTFSPVKNYDLKELRKYSLYEH